MRAWRGRCWCLLGLSLVVAAGVFAAGLAWGLPDRASDAFLFGGREPWSGETIQRLAGGRDDRGGRGADVDVNPLARGDRPVVLNATDAERAEIVRRYRLYTHQPDEMVTLMSLASMSPGVGDFDPKMYQYGGLWIYPVGASIRAGGALGWIHVTSDVTHYLDHPADFGRFYVAARLYGVAWALAAVAAVFILARRWTGGSELAATAAALCFVMMPVVVNAAHEAKPHLAGAALTLWTVIAGVRFVETGRRRWWLIMSAGSGAATGMVLAAWSALAVPGVAAGLYGGQTRRVASLTIGGVLIAAAVYFATNPYVLVHLAGDRAILVSNLGNTAAMFERGLSVDGVARAAQWIAHGTSPVLMLAGLVGVGLFACVGNGAPRGAEDSSRDRAARGRVRTGWLLAVPSSLTLMSFTWHATGQGAAYGRFALLADVALGIVAVTMLGRVVRRAAPRAALMIILLITTAWSSAPYVMSYMKSAGDIGTRVRAAEKLQSLQRDGARVLGLVAEPAPYSMPPVDLFAWRLILLPEGWKPGEERPRRMDVLTGPCEIVAETLGEGFASPTSGGESRLWWLGRARMSWAEADFVIQEY